MRNTILICIALLLGLSFEFQPDWDGVTYMTPDPFYFFDFSVGGICTQTYVFMICEALAVIIYIGIISDGATIYRKSLWLLFGLKCLELIDWFLTYNSVWSYIGDIPISMNVIIPTAFSISVFSEWIHGLTKKYPYW